MAQQKLSPTGKHEVGDSIPGLTQWVGVGIAVSYGVGHRCGSGTAWLWLWCRLAAVALIRPLAWEPPRAAGAALKKTKRKKIKN